MGVTLYEIDFVLWTEDQAGKLRQAREAGSNLDLDWHSTSSTRSSGSASPTGARS